MNRPTRSFAIAVAPALLTAATWIDAAHDFAARTATKAGDDESAAFNLLTWMRPEGHGGLPAIVSFNVYRKIDLQAPYPEFPLNGSPLVVMTSCAAIKQIVPEGSPEWEAVEAMLAEGGLAILPLLPLDIGLKDGGGASLPLLQGPIPVAPPSTPCDIWKLDKGSTKFRNLELLAQKLWKVALVMGEGYRDENVIEGVTYYYEITGIGADGEEYVLQSDLAITAGEPVPPATPGDVAAIAGDSRVLIHWGEVAGAAGFNVYRAADEDGPYELVNDSGLTAKLTHDFNEQPILEDGAPVNGYLDFRRWTVSGSPTFHLVEGEEVYGPVNGVTYFYRTAGVDLLGAEGKLSAPVGATPADATPPAVPKEVTVIPDDAESRIEVRWAKVTHDIDGHEEAKIDGYRVWRRHVPFTSDADLELASPLIPQPGKGVTLVHFFDVHHPIQNPLRPKFGEKKSWYHIEAIDGASNASAKSAGIEGRLRDVTPPAPPASVDAEGLEESIRVTWDPVSELDDEGDETIAGYNIYRGFCDLGEWECIGVPGGGGPSRSVNPDCARDAFAPLGFLSQQDALADGAVWEDRTIPAGSPICYAYLVKTVDEAQNESGAWPPDPELEHIVCERLRDTTPPEPAIVSGLHARDGGIRVEWVGPPEQDIRAYHVYRAGSEDGSYVWVGGLTVENPPAEPQPLDAPYDPQPFGCEVIPLELHEGMSEGAILDAPVDPKTIYFYKVVGVDWNGNEAPLDEAIPVSTFTFTRKKAAAPALLVTPQQSPCGLALDWTPAFDPQEHLGFAVFRSEQAGGPFVQFSSDLLTGGQFLDRRVARGKTYYYRVALVARDGKISQSFIASGQVP
jgi:fibronectin type 3 domain-containing protein